MARLTFALSGFAPDAVELLLRRPVRAGRRPRIRPRREQPAVRARACRRRRADLPRRLRRQRRRAGPAAAARPRPRWRPAASRRCSRRGSSTRRRLARPRPPAMLPAGLRRAGAATGGARPRRARRALARRRRARAAGDRLARCAGWPTWTALGAEGDRVRADRAAPHRMRRAAGAVPRPARRGGEPDRDRAGRLARPHPRPSATRKSLRCCGFGWPPGVRLVEESVPGDGRLGCRPAGWSSSGGAATDGRHRPVTSALLPAATAAALAPSPSCCPWLRGRPRGGRATVAAGAASKPATSSRRRLTLESGGLDPPRQLDGRRPGRGGSGPSPVASAFGGQVIGSTASPRRRDAGRERVAGEDLQVLEARAGPELTACPSTVTRASSPSPRWTSVNASSSTRSPICRPARKSSPSRRPARGRSGCRPSSSRRVSAGTVRVSSSTSPPPAAR